MLPRDVIRPIAKRQAAGNATHLGALSLLAASPSRFAAVASMMDAIAQMLPHDRA
jgi:hypothetical protein